MADDVIPQSSPTTADSAALHCPWCSAELPSADAIECPSCKATLVSTAEAAVPGVTSIDVEAMLRGRREPTKQRGGILGWISGEAGDEMPSAADLKSFEAPSPDVRREMLRLEIEAERQRLEQEAAALALEGRLVNGSPNAETAEVSAEAGQAADSAEASGERAGAADLSAAGSAESETREDPPA
jgi:hypothetical protein